MYMECLEMEVTDWKSWWDDMYKGL